MCIIVYKPYNVAKPIQKVLENCFDSNPDFCGFMIMKPTEKTVLIHKGFSSFKSFWEVAKTLPEKAHIAYHFRIATSGKINAETSQPFPVTSSEKQLRQTKIRHKLGFCHNGIFGKGEGNLSDTQVYLRDCLAPLIKKGEPIYTAFHTSLSKFEKKYPNKAILFDASCFDVHMYGNWIQDKNLYFSNSSYQISFLEDYQRLA